MRWLPLGAAGVIVRGRTVNLNLKNTWNSSTVLADSGCTLQYRTLQCCQHGNSDLRGNLTLFWTTGET